MYRKEHRCESAGAGDGAARRLHVRRRLRLAGDGDPAAGLPRAAVAPARQTAVAVPLQEGRRADERPADADDHHGGLVQRAARTGSALRGQAPGQSTLPPGTLPARQPAAGTVVAVIIIIVVVVVVVIFIF